MTRWHCRTTVTDLSLAWQKVAVAQHASPSSDLSGVRLHVLGDYLHLTATDDNVRGAIYHLRVQGSSDFWAIAPGGLLALVESTFEPSAEIRIGTDGSRIVVRGPGGGECSVDSGNLGAFTLGCFAGHRRDWRTVEPATYWLKGDVRPVESVVLQGRRIEQQYDADTIFDEVYDEYEEDDDASWTPDPQDVQPGSTTATATPVAVPLPVTASSTPPRPGVPTSPTSPGLPTGAGATPSRAPIGLPGRASRSSSSPAPPRVPGTEDTSKEVSRESLPARGESTQLRKVE